MLALIVLVQALTLVLSGPTTSPEYLPLRVAEAEGYFAREGLSVTIRTTRAEPGAADALTQGQADLAGTSLDAMLRFGPRLASQTPRLVFGLTAAPPVALLAADANGEGPRALEHLPGTRVAVNTPAAPEQAWFAWLLARAGMSVAQVAILSRGERGTVTALESGEVHAALVSEPAASRLLEVGRARLLADLRTPGGVIQAIGAQTVHAAVFVRSDRRPRDRDLTAFARAVLAAQRRMASVSAAVLASRLPRAATAPLEDFDEVLAATRGAYVKDGLVTPAQVRETLTVIRAHLPMPVTARIPPAEALLHTEPLRRALSPAPAR